MIVIEGPDGGGKSTLVQQISQQFGRPISHRVVDKDTNALVDLKAWTEKNLSFTNDLYVYDRHRLISEPIYGPIIREKPEPGFDDPQWLATMMWQFYMKKRPLIIYCLPSLETVIENVNRGDDNKVVASKIQSIYTLYIVRYALDIRTGRTLLYDYTQTTALRNALHFVQSNIEAGLC
jgi:hypothetical protein